MRRIRFAASKTLSFSLPRRWYCPATTATGPEDKAIPSLEEYEDVTPSKTLLFSDEESKTLSELLYFEHYARHSKNKEEGLHSARAELGWLIEWAQEKQKMKSDPTDTTSVQKLVRQAVVDRADNHTPLQYIIGNQPFVNLEIMCRPPVFIPRPETEHWVTWMLRGPLQRLRSVPLRIVDLCAGTGCIGLTLAKYSPVWKVFLVEMDPRAFALCEENRVKNELTETAHVIHGDLFHSLVRCQVYGSIDLIVSNPPYVTHKEWISLERVVKEHESPLALYGEKPTIDGLDYYREIALRGKECLKPCATRALGLELGAVVEVGRDQGVSVAEILESEGWKDVEIHQDYTDRDRWVTAKPPKR